MERTTEDRRQKPALRSPVFSGEVGTEDKNNVASIENRASIIENVWSGIQGYQLKVLAACGRQSFFAFYHEEHEANEV